MVSCNEMGILRMITGIRARVTKLGKYARGGELARWTYMDTYYEKHLEGLHSQNGKPLTGQKSPEMENQHPANHQDGLPRTKRIVNLLNPRGTKLKAGNL